MVATPTKARTSPTVGGLTSGAPESPAAVELPPRIARLNEIAFNLWWSWHEPALTLFRSLNPGLWTAMEENPVVFLRTINPQRLDEAAANPAFLVRYDSGVAEYDGMI